MPMYDYQCRHCEHCFEELVFSSSVADEEIKCPYCGIRSQNEFAYGGDATVKRPELNKEVSDKEWNTFVYLRKSPRGKHLELWHHISGCRQWFKILRG